MKTKTWARLFALMIGIMFMMGLGQNVAQAQDAEPIKIGGNGYQCVGSSPLRWKTEESAAGIIPEGYEIYSVSVKAGQGCIEVFPVNQAPDCYDVSISGNIVSVTKIGDGPTCQDISHLEGTGEFPPPPPPPGLHRVGVFKYWDMNGNGVQDEGEPPLQGWTFDWAAASGQTGVLTTDANGYAETEAVLEADQNVTMTERLQDGWVNTTPNPAGVVVSSAGTAIAIFGNNQELPPPPPPSGTLSGDPNCQVLPISSTYDQAVPAQIFVDDNLVWGGNIGPEGLQHPLNFTDNVVHNVRLDWTDPAGNPHSLSWQVGPCDGPPPPPPPNSYPASWKANMAKCGGQVTPVPGVMVLRGQFIVGGWSYQQFMGGWEDSYMSSYVPVLLTQATAVQMEFWPFGMQEWAVRMQFHESNTWEGNAEFGTLGPGDQKSLEVCFPADYVSPTLPDWWSAIDWRPPMEGDNGGYHWANWASFHQANNWPPSDVINATSVTTAGSNNTATVTEANTSTTATQENSGMGEVLATAGAAILAAGGILFKGGFLAI